MCQIAPKNNPILCIHAAAHINITDNNIANLDFTVNYCKVNRFKVCVNYVAFVVIVRESDTIFTGFGVFINLKSQCCNNTINSKVFS